MSDLQSQFVLDSYTLAGAERNIITRRTRHTTQLIDRPGPRCRGHRFLIDNDVSGLSSQEIKGIVDDYVTHAQALGRSPISRPIGVQATPSSQSLSIDLIDDAD